jgi:hypothetical protein
VLAWLQPASLIDYPRFNRLQVRNNLLAHNFPYSLIAPRAVADELLQTLRATPIGSTDSRCPGNSSPCTYSVAAMFRSSQLRYDRREEFEQMLRTALEKRAGPFHAYTDRMPAQKRQSKYLTE